MTQSPRRVLVAVLGLLLVTELALSPFYPQLLRELYGVDDPATVGVLLWACRGSALIALPLLAILARRMSLLRLVAAGLAACAVFDGALVLAPTAPAFIALSAAAAAAGSALLLAYPALVALDDGPARGVAAFVALLHAATIVATAVGAAIVELGDPRRGLAIFAVVDLLLLSLVVRHLPADAALPAAEAPRPRLRSLWPASLAIAALAAIFDVASNVVRPFFTTYVEAAGASLGAAAVLFLLPSAAALATLPFAGALRARFGRALLPSALALGALSLLGQAVAAEPAALVVGRVAFGVALAVAHLEIDAAMYDAVGTDGPGYAAVETVRSAGLVAAPLLAAAAASLELAVPLALGCALFAIAAISAAASITRTVQEERRALAH